jgi:aspartyl-tRNA(Asn)/glutamyl-tRNA(Gln) amidotransferase subunit A
MENLEKYTIKELSTLLKNKTISSLELTKFCLERIKKLDKKVKAFITTCDDLSISDAKASDLRRSKNQELSTIDGIPISIKDIFCTKDVKTTAGSNMLGDFVPPYDATVVKRLKDAGAVIIGKNNLDAWAHGSSTENSDFFTTHNPWDIERVPGGSSGGSAASVASGMSFASFGTDTGGSIRQPAALCGVSGLKPTYGRNSRYGLIAMASSLDCPGIFARSAQDIATYLEIICGNDSLDSTTVSKIKFSAKNTTSYNLQTNKLKIGLPKEYFGKGLDPKVKEKIMDAVQVFKKMGAKIVDISLPNTNYALAVYYIIQPAEVSSNLARFDGIKYGFSTEKQVKSGKLKVKSLLDVYNKSRAIGFGDEAKRRIMIGTYVLSSGYYDAYYKKAMQVRTLVCEDFKKAFGKVDAIITPTTPTTAFKIGEKSKDPLEMYLSDIYTVSANIAGIPGISIPCGFVNDLPVGMQILGPQFSEETILGLANEYQKQTDFHKQMPEIM